MKNYNIIQVKESGTYLKGDTLLVKIKITDSESFVVSDPSEVSITIIDPCGNELVDAAMDSEATGYYFYEYSFASDACCGIYDVNIETINKNQIAKFSYIVFPFDICSRVREVLSAYQQNDISDYKLAIIAWHSYRTVLNDVFELVYNENLYCNKIANDLYKVNNKPLADINGDGVVTGTDVDSCQPDVSFYYINDDDEATELEVKVVDARNGVVEIKDIPSTADCLYITYYYESEYYDEEIMKEAVAYLTAYKVAMTYKSLDKATLADIQTNRQLDPKIFKDKYEELIGMIGFSPIGCGK